jgi:hypothetical protein
MSEDIVLAYAEIFINRAFKYMYVITSVAMYGWDGELDNIVDELFNKRKYITIIPK